MTAPPKAALRALDKTIVSKFLLAVAIDGGSDRKDVHDRGQWYS
jgi:hypothetical protein